MILRKYTENQLRQACSDATSIRNVLIILNVAPYGGNYKTFKKAIKYFSIDTSHFTGLSSNRGRSFGHRRPVEDYLSNKVSIKSFSLKRRLILENIFDATCSNCNNSTWLNNPIPLELDHINGNNLDNSLENIRLLCPNCHALTPTYRGKNQKRSKRS